MMVRRKVFCLISLAVIIIGIQISYVTSTSTLAASHKGSNSEFQHDFNTTSNCPDANCVYLPSIIKSLPEIDVPPCRWAHDIGDNLYISYQWGDRLQTPGSLWRNAFEAGISAWNNASTLTYYYNSSYSNNVINTYDLIGDDRRGYTVISCLVSETVKVEIFGNIYYDQQAGWYTVNQRRGIATHELGHGQSIGHIPNDYPTTSLMYKSTPLSFFSTTYTPQSPDIALVNQIYR